MNQDIHDVIEQIYSAAIEPEKWPDLLYALADTAEKYALSDKDFIHNIEETPFIGNQNLEREQSLVESLKNLDDLAVVNTTKTSDKEMDQISNLLVRHFSQALGMTQKLLKVQEQHETIINLLDKLPIGLIILDAQKNVVNINTAALDILKVNSGLSIKDGTLKITDKKLHNSINSMISVNHSESQPLSHFMTNRSKANNDIVCVISKLNNTISDQKGGVALFLMHRSTQPVCNMNYIIEEYGLTVRETSIAKYLVQGFSIKDIAGTDGVSEHTVRNQVKSILSKTNTRKQSELVCLILGVPDEISDLSNELGPYSQKSELSKSEQFSPIKQFKLRSSHSVYYREYGDPNGEVILHFHSVLGSSCEVPINADLLCKKYKFRLIVPDRPGYGLTDLPLVSHTSEWSNVMEEFLDGLTIDKCILSGYAMGGLFSSAAASHLPQRVSKLVLISYGVVAKTKSDFAQIQPMYSLNQKLAINMPRVHKIFMKVLRKAMYYNTKHFLDKLCEWANDKDKEFIHSDYFNDIFNESEKNRANIHPDAICMDLAMLQRNWGFEIPELHVPTTIWHGEQDRHVPFVLANKLLKHLPNSQVNILDNSGHFMFFTKWERVLSSVNK